MGLNADSTALLNSAALDAGRATADARWSRYATSAFSWFLGQNHLQQDLYDGSTGGCRDGLRVFLDGQQALPRLNSSVISFIYKKRLNRHTSTSHTLAFLSSEQVTTLESSGLHRT